MIPKADIHAHIEGTMRPGLMRELSARNGIAVDPALFRDDGSYAWNDFRHFLDTYDAAAHAICAPEDYARVVYDHFARSAEKGMIYGEVFASPNHAVASGMSYETMVEGLVAGLDRAEETHGVVGRIIVNTVRHHGLDKAIAAAEMAAGHPHPKVTGFGMAGDESYGEHRDFLPAFEIARGAGLRCTAHAGEVLGPESVRAALDGLPIERIGHGVQAIDDPELVARLAAEGIVLEVCPGSNVAIGVYPDLASHPLRRLHEAGVRVTLNSDDPPFFRTDIGLEYDRAQSEMGFTDAELTGFTRTAIEAAFVDEATRETLLAKVAGG
jgi:adenosine deaminase